MKHLHKRVPKEVLSIVTTLVEAEHSAFVVGGAVRDLLFQRPTNDWDIATSATPDEGMKLFSTALPTAVKYGTISVPVRDSMPPI